MCSRSDPEDQTLCSRASAEKLPGGKQKKQDRKIAPLSLPLLYQYHVRISRAPLLPAADTHACLCWSNLELQAAQLQHLHK